MSQVNKPIIDPDKKYQLFRFDFHDTFGSMCAQIKDWLYVEDCIIDGSIICGLNGDDLVQNKFTTLVPYRESHLSASMHVDYMGTFSDVMQLFYREAEKFILKVPQDTTLN